MNSYSEKMLKDKSYSGLLIDDGGHILNFKNPKIIKIIKYTILIGLILTVVGIVIFISIQNYVNKLSREYMVDIDNAPVCDAVLVLGARVYDSYTPSPILADRLDYGYDLYINKKAKKIIVSGDHRRKDYDEVNAMKSYLMDKGVPREDIFLDHAGFDTYDSMYRARDIFEVKSLLISTQQFHINRSVYIARRLGLEAYGYPCEDKEVYNMEYLNFRESFAKVKAVIETDILKRKPEFLGDTIPISGNGIDTDG